MLLGAFLHAKGFFQNIDGGSQAKLALKSAVTVSPPPPPNSTSAPPQPVPSSAVPTRTLGEYEEIPLDALLGGGIELQKWLEEYTKMYRKNIDSLGAFVPVHHKVVSQEVFNGISLTTVQFEYPQDSPLFGAPAGGVLAVPEKIDPKNPIVVAIHGHEHSPWCQHPVDLFKKEKWPYELAREGYIVWAPVSMCHEQVADLAQAAGGYPLVWTKIISDGLNYGKENIWGHLDHTGLVSVGLSSGGQVAYSLMAYRDDIEKGIFAGTNQDLDFLRREYTIKGHPDCWDVHGIGSFTAIQALLAPRPVQFQIGRRDPFFPNKKPMEPRADWFKGTTRGQLSSEVGGNALIVKNIYRQMDAEPNFSFLIHEGGHEFRSAEALDFLRKQTKPKEAN
ncbi:MAG: hypothetical protein HDQ94_02365 [Desulfovibrio sp.]|nr:hypothetical protein [Desulfovibrio sp.]